MDYQLGWSENHPGHVVYLLDLSGSMAENGKIDRLITAVHDVVKDLIQQSAPSGCYTKMADFHRRRYACGCQRYKCLDRKTEER